VRNQAWLLVGSAVLLYFVVVTIAMAFGASLRKGRKHVER